MQARKNGFPKGYEKILESYYKRLADQNKNEPTKGQVKPKPLGQAPAAPKKTVAKPKSVSKPKPN